MIRPEGAALLDWTSGEPALLVSRCIICGHGWYLPRDVCPACSSGEVQRQPAAGTGVVSASTIVRRGAIDAGSSSAVGIALVDLDEGVRVMARCTPGIPVGTRARAGYLPGGGDAGAPPLLPCFSETRT